MKLSELDDVIRNILDQQGLDAAQKLALYNASLNRYNEIHRRELPPKSSVAPSPAPVSTKTETEEPVPPPPPAMAVAKEEAKVDIDYEADVNKKYSKNATELYEYFKAKPNVIGVNEKGELLYHGESIAGSKYSDLVKHLYTPIKSHNLVGVKSFYKALRELNVPEHVISSTASKKEFIKSQTGKGRSKTVTSRHAKRKLPSSTLFHSAPSPSHGQHPRILLVYV